MIPLYLILFLLQCTVFPQFDLFSCTPNLILCLTVLITLKDDGFTGLILGIGSGLLMDMFFGQMIGISALCYFGLTLLIMVTKSLTYKSSTTSVLIFGLASTVLYSLMYWGISSIMGSGYHLWYMLKMLPQLLIYNSIVIFVMHVVMRRQERMYPEDRFM